MERNIKSAWSRYQDSLTYMAQIGIKEKAPKWVDLYEGRQWPAATELTKTMPRPVVNIVKMIARNKKAGVLSSPVALHFVTDNLEKDVEKFDRFAEYIARELDQEEKDAEGIEDKIKKGTCAWHYYWNTSKQGMPSNVDGSLDLEIIDPLNVHVANPNQKDVEKQKWIMISTREELEAVLANTDTKYKEHVKSDTSESPYHEVEKDNEQYVTVLTEYFKDKNGEVFWQKHTSAGAISDPVSMTPTIEETKPKGEGVAETALPDEPEDKALKNVFRRYPIVIGVWDSRDKSYLGIGEVESLEPNQKAINLGMGLQLLKVQNEAFGKWAVKEDALEGQTITSEIMQVLTDHSKLGDGIKKLPESPISGTPMDIINGLTDQTRMVTGATEVMSGEVISAGMSGAAIATLQAQAMKPIEEKQKSFWRDKQRQGLIMAEFFKFYYEDKEFTYTKKDKLGKDKPERDTFNGSDYQDTDFKVVVQAGAATAFSEGGDIAMLEMLVSKDLISAKTFIESYPKTALSNSKEILEAFERAEQSQVAQLTAQIQQAQAQMTKAADIIKAQSESIDKAVLLVQENQRLKQEILALGSEFTQKITEANAQILEAKSDAAEFAQVIAKNAGIKPVTSPITQAKQ